MKLLTFQFLPLQNQFHKLWNPNGHFSQHFSPLKKEGRKGQAAPGPGGETGPLGIIRRWFLRRGAEKIPPRRNLVLISAAEGKPNRCFQRVPLRPPGPKRCSQTIRRLAGSSCLGKWRNLLDHPALELNSWETEMEIIPSMKADADGVGAREGI